MLNRKARIKGLGFGFRSALHSERLTLPAQFFILVAMLVIRFQRVGRTNDPAFRIVVTERRSKPKSGGVEMLGSYHPKTKAAVLKHERILHWLSKGAHTSPTVHNLFVAKGVLKGQKIHVVPKAAPKPSEEKKKEAA